jgi:RNA polymerase sigma-70 factor (ECF subfamily)
LPQNEERFAIMDSGREATLVADAQGGSREAFLELVRHYRRPIYRLAYAMTRSEAGAEALATETFVRAWKGVAAFPSGRHFFPWLLGIARTVPRPAAERHDQEDSFLDSFDALREDDRLALALGAVEHLGYEEIAALLRLPIGIAAMRISQARSLLMGHAASTRGGDA